MSNNNVGTPAFIESPNFPVDAVNEASAKEKGPGRPSYWEMVFWWTRKPLAGARAVIAGALLPADTPVSDFMYYLRLTSDSVAHRVNPGIPEGWKGVFTRARLLDPFAGFGSIPLESVRLGLGEVVASELLPTAYVFLKAVLEYPKWAVERKVGKKLIEDVGRYGEWIVSRLRDDQDIRELYEEDVAVYIGTWEVKCPHCSKWTPLVGNWWLARVSGGAVEEEEGEEAEEGSRSGEFKRLAWMEPVRVNDSIAFKVRDLNRELGRRVIRARVNAGQERIVVDGATYTIPARNIDARRETATCLHCNNTIRKGDKEWYVKEALKDWNHKLEQYLSGQIDLQALKETAKARPRLLVKVKIANNDLVFEPATQEDNEKLWKALEKLRQIWGDPDIPTEPLPPYGSRGMGGDLKTVIWGFDKWFKHFNPRQLLTLVKLVKLIREAGKKIEKEKLKEGWSKEEAFRYAEAVTTYLAIALCRHIYDNAIVTSWNPATGFGSSLALLRSSHALAYRGIAMVWNWAEYPVNDGVLGYLRDLKHVANGLSYLVSAVSGSPSRVMVLLDDATVLSKLGGEKFDVIVTDPPYRDDVPYAELSDFYYVWLKRALSDVSDVGGMLVRQPRFIPEAFFRDGVEVDVQWREFAVKEISENDGRARFFSPGASGFEQFKQGLTSAFKSMADRLVDNGILVTYYAHTSPDAWEALLEAGWHGARLRITATHAFITESAQRVTARGKAGLDISIVAVWRKGVSGQVSASEAYAEAVEKCVDHASNLLKKGFEGVNLFTSVLGCILSVFTRYEKVVGAKGIEDLVRNYIYPATAETIARALGGGEFSGRLSNTSLFYLLSKVLVARRPRQERRTLDRSTVTILAIGTRSEINSLRGLKIIEQDGERFQLLEPVHGERDLVRASRSVLEDKEINPVNPVLRTAVDMVHLLEHYAVSLPRGEFSKRVEELRARYPAFYEEALSMARILRESLQAGDPEHELVRHLVNALIPGQTGIGKWTVRDG